MLTFRAVDPANGNRTVEEFAGAVLKGDIVQVIGRGEPVTVEIPWPDRMPGRWEVATTPGRMVLLCEDEHRVWWGGLIIERSFGHSPTMTVQADAPEGLLGRTFVPDLTFQQVTQTQIMADLGLYWLADALHGRVEVGPSTVLRDRTYKDEDDKPRIDMMENLMRVINGPEFMTRWDRNVDGTTELVCLTADRLGLAATPDEPPTVELYPDDWTYTHSYGDGKGAPIVRASTTKEGTPGEDGTGEQEKISEERRDDHLLANGWVPLEQRFTPETGSVSPDIIGQYADGRLADLRMGTISITAKMLAEHFPADLHLGDDVSIVLHNDDIAAPGAPRMLLTSLGLAPEEQRPIAEIVARARLLGWALTPDGNEITQVTLVLDLKEVTRW